MRKILSILLCILILSCLLSGCGSGSETVYDEDGNASITSEWRLVEFTVNDNTTVIANDPPLVRIFTAHLNPAFSCPDGTNCTLRNGRKSHSGTVTKEDGKYMITFDDTSVAMIGEISGNVLTLQKAGGKLEIVFKTGTEE